MSLEEDRLRSLRFERPSAIPVSVGILPAAWMKYRQELDVLVHAYPEVCGGQVQESRDYEAAPTTYVAGNHVDAWGCVWQNVHTGREAIVTGHPVPTRAAVRALKAPERDAGLPHGFMYLRLQDLRGFEELMLDFAEEPPELAQLIDTVLGYNLRQVERLRAGVTGTGRILYFGDDLGMQHSLPMGPAKWRQYLKPCFSRIYAPVKAAGHYVYMHTDGHIAEIIGDLKDCGVDVVNPQIGANGFDALERECRGRICVDLDLDRQLFPFWTPAEIDAHVRQSVERLGSPEGGLWLKAEIGDDVPLENAAAILAALEKYRHHFA
ncbi:MAG: uroporphyrinogen decarboxylase family protein [Gemmatimonadota bacterium]